MWEKQGKKKTKPHTQKPSITRNVPNPVESWLHQTWFKVHPE